MISNYPFKQRQKASTDGLCRHGISEEYLRENHVRHVDAQQASDLVGCPVEGLLLPYYDTGSGERSLILDPTDKPFCRLRKAGVQSGNKYHQPAGTAIHAYVPRNWRANTNVGDLTIVEGEFKSLSLTDPHLGYTTPAIGISGFYGFARKKQESELLEMAPELAEALAIAKPGVVHFLGDQDTALNYDFSVAVVRLKSLLPHVELRLPRIDYLQEKGIDDIRENKGRSFERYYEELKEKAVLVESNVDPGTLAIRLIEQAWDTLKVVHLTRDLGLMPRLVKLAARLEGPLRELLYSQVKRNLKVGTTNFRAMVKDYEEKEEEQLASEKQEELRGKIKHFHYAGKAYWRQDQAGTYSPLTDRRDVMLHLKQELNLSRVDVDTALYLIQTEHRVDYAGPLPGFPPGILHQNEKTLLIPTGPKWIQPVPGDCIIITNLLEGLMGKGWDPYYEDQLNTLYGWLHQMRKALKNLDVHLPGQAMGLFGPAGIGKGLVPDYIFTPLFGGRQADPMDFLLGHSAFNASLFGAESLVLSDAGIALEDQKTKQKLRSGLKRIIANELQVLSPKFGDQLNLRPVRRLTVCGNLDVDSLQLIPSLTSDIRDKLILLRCYRATGYAGAEPEHRRDFIASLKKALPAFAAFIDSWQIPQDYDDDRFGVGAFHHPELLSLVKASDPVRDLAGMVESVLRDANGQPVIYTAEGWFKALQAKFGTKLAETASNPTELGRLLSTLKRRVPGWDARIDNSQRIQYGQNRNYHPLWRIVGS